MEAKKASTSSKLVSYIGIGAIAIAALGLSYYLLRKRRKSSHEATKIPGTEANRLPKELVIKIFKELRREMYCVSLEIQQIIEESKQFNLNSNQKRDIECSKLFSGSMSFSKSNIFMQKQ